jgi:hypothetical protein
LTLRSTCPRHESTCDRANWGNKWRNVVGQAAFHKLRKTGWTNLYSPVSRTQAGIRTYVKWAMGGMSVSPQRFLAPESVANRWQHSCSVGLAWGGPPEIKLSRPMRDTSA